MDQSESRSLGFLAILWTSLRVCGAALLKFLAISLAISVPVIYLCALGVGDAFRYAQWSDVANPFWLLSALFSMLGLFIGASVFSTVLANAILLGSVYRQTIEPSQGLPDAGKWSLRKVLDLLLASIMTTVAILAGLLLFVVPGILMSLRLAFVGQVVAAEGRGCFKALLRSNELASLRWGRIFGMNALLAGIFCLALWGGDSTLLTPDIGFALRLPSLVHPLLVLPVMLPFVSTCLVLLYFDARASAEGRSCRVHVRGGHPFVQVLVAAGVLVLCFLMFVFHQRGEEGPPPRPAAQTPQVEPPPAALSAVDRDLFDALSDGGARDVSACLANGANVNARDDRGWTPLHRAVFSGKKEMIEVLVGAGADVNAKDERGFTVLHWLAETRSSDVGIAELLIERGADPNGGDGEAVVPLHIALRTGHQGMIKLLVRKGANLTARDQEGRTPLRAAVDFGREEVVQDLLEAGAPVDIVTASALGMADRVKALLEADPTLARMRETGISYEATPLHKAAHYGHKDVVELLLRYGADVDAGDATGATALHEAVYGGWEGIAELLLRKGAAVNAMARGSISVPGRVCHKYGDTPLHLAARRGDVAMVKILLEHGANVKARNAEGGEWLGPPRPGSGLSPLGVALKEGHKEVADLLRQHGASE